MKVNGYKMKIRKTEEVFKYGLTDQDMMDFGKMVLRKVMVGWCTPKEISMKENGWMIKLTVMVFILILMEANMKDNG